MTLELAVLLVVVAALLTLSAAATVLGRAAAATALVYVAVLVGTTVATVSALSHLLGSGGVSGVVLPLGLPWLGTHFRLDALAAFFLIVVNLGGAVASLYGLGYGRHEKAPHRVLPFYAAFLAGMNLVVLADDAFTFLLSWEFMSLVSWALVMAHHREEANARAGYIYLVMASLGTISLLLAFGVLAGVDGGYAFGAIRSAEYGPGVSALVLGLVLVGAGSKAGLVPLHVWLPLAHPAAPSHVSALMSGVMTKVAVYGFVRIVFDLIGEVDWWLSAVVMLIGGLTAVLGILHAALEQDLKRLLAYSTIENIGVIFISLGLALAFHANGLGWAAALALTAALFHVFNHSLFKSLLFLGAGAVLTATGQRDVDRLGGLIHRMPWTSVAVLAGCLAISALPPLNGFVSEWLAFQAIVNSPDLPQWGLKVLVPAIGGILALTAALVAATFVKVFGMTFLGRPRSEAAEEAKEVDRFSLAALLLLVALCLLAGILPGAVIDALAPVTLAAVGERMPVQLATPWLTIAPIAEGRSSYNGVLVLLFITVSAATAVYIIHRFASRAVRRGPAWGCGFPPVGPVTQYSGTSFTQPLRRIFGPLAFKAREQVDMPAPGDLRPARLVVSLSDPVWSRLYAPVLALIGWTTRTVDKLQFLTIRQYLSLVFGALILMLLVLALWP